MTALTDDDREMIYRDTYARSYEQWQEILANLGPEDAAARIFGDLYCYTPDRRVKGYPERRQGFHGDVNNLARALQAWAALSRHNLRG